MINRQINRFYSFLLIIFLSSIGLMISSCKNNEDKNDSDDNDFRYCSYTSPFMLEKALLLNRYSVLNNNKLEDYKIFPVIPDKNKNIYINIGANYFIMSYQLYRPNVKIYGFDSLINNNTFFKKYFSKYLLNKPKDTLSEWLGSSYNVDCGFDGYSDWLNHKTDDSIGNSEQSSILFGSWLEALYVHALFYENKLIELELLTDISLLHKGLISYFEKYHCDSSSNTYIKEVENIDSIFNKVIIIEKAGKLIVENDSLKTIPGVYKTDKVVLDVLIKSIIKMRNKYL